MKRITSKVRTLNTEVIRTITPRQLAYCITLAHLETLSPRWHTLQMMHCRYLHEYLVDEKGYEFTWQAITEFYHAIRSLNLKAPHLVALKHAPLAMEQYTQGCHLLRELHSYHPNNWYPDETHFNRRAIVAKLFRTYDMATRKAIANTWLESQVYTDNRTMTQRLNDMARRIMEIPF